MRILGIMILMIMFSFSSYAQTIPRKRMESRGDQIQRKGSKQEERGNGLVGKKSPAMDNRQGNRKKKR